MLRGIRIQNLRSLIDTENLSLKPIVLLVGANSSGKSTFLRFFPLLRQTSTTSTNEPLLWFGDDVDFGDFDAALRKQAEPKTIRIHLALSIPKAHLGGRQITFPGIPEAEGDQDVVLEAEIASNNSGGAFVKQFKLHIADDEASLSFLHEGVLSAVNINGTPYKLDSGRKVPASFDSIIPTLAASRQSLSDSMGLNILNIPQISALIQKIPPIFSSDVESQLRFLATYMRHDTAENVLNQIESIGHNFSRERRKKVALKLEDAKVIKNALFIQQLPTYLQDIESYIRLWSRGIRYIGPFRTTPERFYRKQALAADRITRDGSNLAMFLNALGEAERSKFSNFVWEHFGFGVDSNSTGAHVSLNIVESSSASFNLVDTGFGLSQVLPIVAQLWLATRAPKSSSRSGRLAREQPTLLAIEQPELHLHPRYQARLADMMAAVVKQRKTRGAIPLVIETHSEALVNRFGELVADNVITHNDIEVLVFERQNGGVGVRHASYDKEGILRNWPMGFFSP